MWEEVERSPMLAAPGSNEFAGLVASSTVQKIGKDDDKLQVLSDEEANDLCAEYIPLVLREAGRYRNSGVDFDALCSAGYFGLVQASRRYDPARGTFGAYARCHVRGEILACFKPGKGALGGSCSLHVPAFKEDSEGESALDYVIDETPLPLNPDLSSLTDKECHVVLGRAAGETLGDVGKAINISAERVRQIEVHAHSKLRKSEGRIARACIRDLVKRRGYQKPYWDYRGLEQERLRGRAKYPCRSCGNAEIEAYEPQKRFRPPNTLPPLWAPLCSRPTPQNPKIEIKGGNDRFRSLKRPGEVSATESDAAAYVRALKLDGYAGRPVPRDSKSTVELDRYRNEEVRRLNGVPHTYKPKRSRQLAHHRSNADALAVLRGDEPIENPRRGAYGGPVIHAWGRR